jgi:hypothetical protein
MATASSQAVISRKMAAQHFGAISYIATYWDSASLNCDKLLELKSSHENK